MKLGPSPTDPLLAEAAKHGLAKDREPAFLLWVGNECWEGREVMNFDLLTARARPLVKMFQTEDAELLKRLREQDEAK